MRNGKYMIITFCSFAIFLLAMAFFTLNITYAYQPEKDAIWDVYLGDITYRSNKDIAPVTVNNEYMDFNASLKDYGDTFSFIVPIINDGTIDAYLKEINLTELNDVVGTSPSGKTYYVSDYVSYNVTYERGNDDNNISADVTLKEGDTLHAKTQNNLAVNVEFIGRDRLTEEAIIVLDNSTYKVNKDGTQVNGFNLHLQLGLNYQELK